MIRKHFILLALFILLSAIVGVPLAHAQDRPDATTGGMADIDLFMSAGAEAYLAWQYSGDENNPFENDPYSFFKGGTTCQLLQSASAKYPGKIGVNMFHYQLRQNDSVMDGRNIPAVDIAYLKNNCGTSIVRFFAWDTDAEVNVQAVKKLQSVGIKSVVAIGNSATLKESLLDYFNPGNYAADKAKAVAIAEKLVKEGLTGSIFTLELMNEPHCGNDAACIPRFIAWVKDVTSAIRATGYTGPISIGQAASIGQADIPGMGYEETNNVPAITHASGHHYDEQGVQYNLQAAAIAKSLKKVFYIGEAALEEEVKNKYFVYAGIEDVMWRKGVRPAKDLASRYVLTCAPSYFLKSEVSNESTILDDPKIAGFDTIAKYCAPRKSNPAGSYNANNPEAALCYFDPVSKKLVVTDDKIISGKFPLYRRDGKTITPQQRTVSFEAFFGANVQNSGVAGYNTTLNTSPVRRLQDRETSCREVVKYMRVAEALCNPKVQAVPRPDAATSTGELVPESRDECALNVKTQTGKKLFETWDKVRLTINNANASLPPNQKLAYEDYCSGPTNIRANDNIYDELLSIQPTTFNAFKKAYLVYYNPSFEKDKGAMNLTASDKILGSTEIQTFFRKHELVKDPDRIDPAVNIIPILVPSSVFAQKDDFQGLGENTTYQSSFARTMDILRPTALTEQRKKEKASEVADMFGQLLNPKNDPLDGCLGGRPYLVNTGQKDYSGCYNPLDTQTAIEDDPALAGPQKRISMLRAYFQDLLTRRINAGIRNGELRAVMGETPPEDPFEYSTKCEQYPTEKTTVLNSKINSYPYATVFENLVQLNARVRIAGDAPKEKFGIKSYLLLPEDYRNVRDAEIDFISMFVPEETKRKILRQQNPASPSPSGTPSALTGGTANPQTGTTTTQPGKMSSFLRMGGIFPKLSGFGVDDSPKSFRLPLPNPIPDFWLQVYKNPAAYPREYVDVSPTLKDDNLTSNFNPLVPGGMLARGVFEIMAHVLAPLGSKNYQQYFCGLESYWLGRSCTAQIAIETGDPIAEEEASYCANIWPSTATAKSLGEELKKKLATQAQRDLWKRYYAPYVPNGTQYLFERIPECGNQLCYEYIIDKAVNTTSNGTSINPYVAISIALNENGGLKVDNPERTGRHFGCGVSTKPGDSVISSDTIDKKLDCMLGALKGYKDAQNLGNVASLKKYGYTNGGGDLFRITKLLNPEYDLTCAEKQ